MKTVIYARKSTMKASQSDTIDNQIKTCKRRAKELGLQIVDIKTDSASGTSDKNRDEIKELISGAMEGKYECVIMKGISRFYRDVENGIGLIKKLDRSNIRVITIEENFDSQNNRTGTGQLDTSLIAMYLVFAENESKKTSERIKYTQIEKAHAGEWNQVSNVPFGYKYDKETKKLEVDTVSSEVIKLIFNLYLSGVGMKSIAFYLNGDNENGQVYPSPKGKLWSQYTIGYILKNQVYTGDIVFNKRSKNARPYKNPESIGKTDDDVYIGNDYNDRKDWIITPNAHTAIVSREEFDKVKSIMGTKAIRKGIKNNVSLLASVAKCGKCGSGMTFKRGNKDKDGRVKTIDNYYCSGYIKYGNKYCDSHHLSAKEFESIIIDSLKNKLKDTVDYSKATSGARIGKTDLDVLKDKIKKVEKDMQNISSKTDALLEKNLIGDINDAQFKRLNERYIQEMGVLEQSLITLKLEEENSAVDEDSNSKIKRVYDQVMNMENFSVEEQRYLILDLIEKITITDGKIIIKYAF